MAADGGEVPEDVTLFVPPVYDVLAVLALVVPAALVTVVVVLVARAALRRAAPSTTPASHRLRTYDAVVSAIAWGGLLLVGPPALALMPTLAGPVATAGGDRDLAGPLGVGLCVLALGLPFLVVHAAGEGTRSRSTGLVRRAYVGPRPAPPRSPLRTATAAWVALLGATLAACAVAAGRTGTAAPVEGYAIPRAALPDWHHGVAIACATSLLLALTAAVVRLVRRRPTTPDADPVEDADLRALGEHRVLRGTQLVVGLTLAGVLGIAAAAAYEVADGAAGAGATAASAVAALTAVGLALVPAPRTTRASEPTAPERATAP